LNRRRLDLLVALKKAGLPWSGAEQERTTRATQEGRRQVMTCTRDWVITFTFDVDPSMQTMDHWEVNSSRAGTSPRSTACRPPRPDDAIRAQHQRTVITRRRSTRIRRRAVIPSFRYLLLMERLSNCRTNTSCGRATTPPPPGSINWLAAQANPH